MMMSYSEPDLQAYGRERIVLQIIKDHPKLHHNALLKIIVPKYMAKTTFEKTRDSLLDKQIIHVKNQSNMKFYTITSDYENQLQQRIEKNTNNSFHDLKLHLKKLDPDFLHKDIDEKINLARFLLVNLIRTDNGFTFLDSTKNPKKTLYHDEHLEIQQLLCHLLKIIKKDKDSEIILLAISGNIESLMFSMTTR